MPNRVLSRLVGAAVVTTLLAGCAASAAESRKPANQPSAPNRQVEQVAPALAAYHEDVVDRLWTRDGIAARDRSLVTVAALIAGNQTDELRIYVERALQDGVEPREISETLTHLAFYSGWQNAREAVPAIAAVFEAHDVDPSELPEVEPELLPLDDEAEQARAAQVESDYGHVSPGVVASTTDVLFRDLWLRPDLAPRDRSLVTVVALVATGQSAQITFHLNRAMDNGLTRPEIGEVLHQLAFYAGWPKVFSAMPVVRDVLDTRS